MPEVYPDDFSLQRYALAAAAGLDQNVGKKPMPDFVIGGIAPKAVEEAVLPAMIELLTHEAPGSLTSEAQQLVCLYAHYLRIAALQHYQAQTHELELLQAEMEAVSWPTAPAQAALLRNQIPGKARAIVTAALARQGLTPEQELTQVFADVRRHVVAYFAILTDEELPVRLFTALNAGLSLYIRHYLIEFGHTAG